MLVGWPGCSIAGATSADIEPDGYDVGRMREPAVSLITACMSLAIFCHVYIVIIFCSMDSLGLFFTPFGPKAESQP